MFWNKKYDTSKSTFLIFTQVKYIRCELWSVLAYQNRTMYCLFIKRWNNIQQVRVLLVGPSTVPVGHVALWEKYLPSPALTSLVPLGFELIRQNHAAILSNRCLFAVFELLPPVADTHTHTQSDTLLCIRYRLNIVPSVKYTFSHTH